MSFNNIKTRMQDERGFTIVELLIVIVVIGILAAITIVSFNGVTARANTANAQSAEESTVKKLEAYNAENSKYPVSVLTTLENTTNANTSFFLTGVALVTTMTSAPTTAATVLYSACGTNGTSTAPVTPATNITIPTGATVGYWNYSTNSLVTVNDGVTSGNYNTFPVACIPNAT